MPKNSKYQWISHVDADALQESDRHALESLHYQHLSVSTLNKREAAKAVFEEYGVQVYNIDPPEGIWLREDIDGKYLSRGYPLIYRSCSDLVLAYLSNRTQYTSAVTKRQATGAKHITYRTLKDWKNSLCWLVSTSSILSLYVNFFFGHCSMAPMSQME
jgi:hypothetical protein